MTMHSAPIAPEESAASVPAPEPRRLSRGHDGQLLAHLDGRAVPVTIRRCFPWSATDRFVSLRDENDEEVWLIDDVAALDDASRQAAEASLLEAGFVLVVERVESLETELEIRVWRVQTRQGPRTLQTKHDDWPREVPGGGLVFRDVSGDLFYIPDPDDMDETSQKLLWAFVD